MLDKYRNERRYNKQIKSSHRSLIFTTELHDIFVLSSGNHVREMYTPLYRKKLGFAGINMYLVFLIKNIHCGYPVLSENI